MERRKTFGGKFAALAFIVASSLITTLPEAASAQQPDAPAEITINGRKIKFPKADGLVALKFEPSLPAEQARRAAETEASSLGLDVVESQVGSYQLIVKGSAEEVQGALARRSDISGRVTAIRPVFYYNGVVHPDYMLTIPDRLVVGLDKNLGVDEREALFLRYGLLDAEKIMDNVYRATPQVSNEEIPALAARIAEENPGTVRFAEPSMEMKIKSLGSTAVKAGDLTVDPANHTGADPLFSSQWHLHHDGRNTPGRTRADMDVDAPRAWNPNIRGETRGDAREFGYFGYNGTRPLIVAVFDTGSDLDHEDFVRNTNDPFVSGKAGANVLRTDIDYDYMGNDSLPDAGILADDAHGTAVAGLIGAARNNGVGGVGVAPEVQIVTQRILSAFGSVSTDVLAEAIVDASNAGADIGNHSYGGPGDSSVVREAFDYAFYTGRFGKGMANFAAAGNEFNYMSYPALYPSTFAVGGIGESGNRVSYSSWGGTLDFVAPTDNIVTTDLMGNEGYDGKDASDALNPDGHYTFTFNGTSAATPIVTGVAALIMAEYPDISVPPVFTGGDSLFDLMVKFADRPGDPKDYIPGWSNIGRVEGWSMEQRVLSQDALDPLGFRRKMGYKVDGFNQFKGYGMPNPYRVVTEQTAQSSFRDYLRLPDIADELTTQGIRLDFGELVLVYQSNFTQDYLDLQTECIDSFKDEEGNLPDDFPTADDLEDIEACIRSSFGEWEMSGPRTFDGDDIGPVETHYYLKTSPYTIEHVGEYQPGDENLFPVVIHSNIPTVGVEEDEFYYNPRGRYLRNGTYVAKTIVTIPEDLVETQAPLFLDITIQYELGIQNGSNASLQLNQEFDTITIMGNNRTLATLQGDSNNFPIPPLFPATHLDDDDVPQWAFYGAPLQWFYEGLKAPPEFRTFRFYMGEATSSAVEISVTMQTGPSYLPEWSAPDEDGIREQLEGIFRDHRGFQIADVKVWAGDYQEDENTFLTAQDIMKPSAIQQAKIGTRPQWTTSGNDVIFVDTDKDVPHIESTVYTIESDKFVRRMVPGSTTQIEVEERQPVPLFRACVETPDHINDCTPAQIISLDSDKKRSRLIYVADSSPSEPRVYLVTEDGFGEYPLFPFDPQTDITPYDVNVQEAVFGQLIDTVFFTDRNSINAVSLETGDIEFIIDTAVIKNNPALDSIEDFRDIASDVSDTFVFFSALNRETNDYNIYATVRRANIPGAAGFYQPIIEWDSSQELHNEMSPDGLRLAFVSNTIDDGQGAVPPPNAPWNIYIIDNVLDLALYPGSDPAIQKVTLNRDIRLERIGLEQYASALFPSFHPTGTMMSFVGYQGAVTGNRGEVATVKISGRTTSPITLPDPYNPGPSEPFPTMDAEPVARVTHQGQNLFDVSNDGWEFLSTTLFKAPIARSESGLEIRSNNDNLNTYGFFVSPINSLQLFNFPTVLQASSTPFEERETPNYLLRYYLRRTSDNAADAPILRLRVNSSNFEDYHTLVATSTGSNSAIPDKDHATAVDLLFQPSAFMYKLPRASQTYYISVDLINMDGTDDPNGGYILDRFDLFRVPNDVVETIGTVKDFTFDSQEDFDAWTSYSFPESFTSPVFSTGPSRLEMAAVDPAESFGQWQNRPGTVTLTPTGLEGTVYLRMTAYAGSQETNPMKVPEMRFRVARDDWSVSSDHGVIGMSTGTFIPTAGNNRVFRAFVKVPTDQLPTVGFHGSWDLLSFETFNTPEELANLGTSTNKVTLDRVKFDLIRIIGYPEVDPNP